MKKLFICVVIFASSLYSCQNEQSTLDELGQMARNQTGKKSIRPLLNPIIRKVTVVLVGI
jgi:hypothetical protein